MWQRIWNGFTAQNVFTFFIALFTGTLWWTSYRQWHAMRAQNEFLIRQFEATQAPYIVFTAEPQHKIVEFTDDYYSEDFQVRLVTISVHFKNVGHSVAEKLFTQVEAVLAEPGHPGHTRFPQLTQQDYDLNGFDLAPGDATDGERAILGSEYDAVQNRRAVLYVLVRVNYFDLSGFKCVPLEVVYLGPKCGFQVVTVGSFTKQFLCSASANNNTEYNAVLPATPANCWPQKGQQ